jgi:prepilin-type N-terminal cleavage/methylation domain-containing protein
MEMVRTAAGEGMLTDRRGFSLMELLVAMTIMGVLLALATLSFQGMTRRYSEEKQVKQLYNDLLNTRIRAMQQGRDHFVSLVSNTMYRIYEDTFTAPEGNGVLDIANDALLGTQNVLPAHTLVTSIPTTTPVQFNSKGLVPATQTGWIRINPSIGAEYDCVLIDQIKTRMGNMNGANCIVQ